MSPMNSPPRASARRVAVEAGHDRLADVDVVERLRFVSIEIQRPPPFGISASCSF
jgi:hypothetical protein